MHNFVYVEALPLVLITLVLVILTSGGFLFLEPYKP